MCYRMRAADAKTIQKKKTVSKKQTQEKNTKNILKQYSPIRIEYCFRSTL